MNNLFRIVLCGLLIVALASPVFADGGRTKRAKRSWTSSVYAGANGAVDQTAGICTGCLKRTFSLFNPCLDAIKGCTSIVMWPIDKPFEYVEQSVGHYWNGKKAAKARSAR